MQVAVVCKTADEQADEIRLYQTSFVMASLVPWIREENMYAIE